MDLDSPIKTPFSIDVTHELQKDTEELLESGTWIWNVQAGTMNWSEGLCRLLGYSGNTLPSKITLNSLLQHLPEKDQPNFTVELKRSMEQHTLFHYTHVLITQDGNKITVVTKAKPKFGNDDELIAMTGVVQNINRYAKLQEEGRQYKELMDQYEIMLQFGTWEYMFATKKLSWSVGMYQIFGYDPVLDKDKELTEEIYRNHILPDDYLKGEELRKMVLENQTEYFWQYRIKTTKGEIKWLETYGRIVLDHEGKRIKTVGITRNITRLKNYEHSLEAKIKELNRSNAELEEFAYVASHDLQEPLRKLSTFSERLTAKYSIALQDEGQLYINRILAATNNMRLLIENLLDFSRVARTPDPFEATDLNDTLRKVLGDLEVSIEEKHARITSENLATIEAQAPLMKQLFTNILSNALKFRKPEVSPLIEISCHTLSSGDADKHNLNQQIKYYKIDVKDNGIGFEQEYAERIFQIFQRLHGKAEYPGSGIGLAICKKIVDYHNGVIYATGRLDEGTVITIILPEKQ